MIKQLTIQDEDIILEKYGLGPVGGIPQMGFYTDRSLILGKRGEIKQNITTGPCLLGISDIQRIKSGEFSFEDMMALQPTLQNVLCGAFQADGDIRVCLETYEFAKMAEEIFDIEFDHALKVMDSVADRTEEIIRTLHHGQGTLYFYRTHETALNTHLSELTRKNFQTYLEIMQGRRSDAKVHARLKKQTDAGRDPNDLFKLRIFSTYLPGWWGEEGEHTIAENIYNISTYMDPGINDSWVALVPLRSQEWKKEMAQGSPIYVGNEKGKEKALEELKKQIPRKSPQQCNIGNILPYTAMDVEGMSTLLECASIGDLDAGRCKRCYENVADFLKSL